MSEILVDLFDVKIMGVEGEHLQSASDYFECGCVDVGSPECHVM
ncbi:MAG: hypothetical protein ACYDEH_00455 [Acidimicrobiales bacterium]